MVSESLVLGSLGALTVSTLVSIAISFGNMKAIGVIEQKLEAHEGGEEV